MGMKIEPAIQDSKILQLGESAHLGLLSQVAPGWKDFVEQEFCKTYMKDLQSFLKQEKSQKEQVLPEDHKILRALQLVDLDQVKVVILGQDPYHGPGQANGLCFAVSQVVAVPPSLRNIQKELHLDLKQVHAGFDVTLEEWAAQGVLLLNTVLTVRLAQPLSHRARGWEIFTAGVIDLVNSSCQNVVFILWGAQAQAHLPRIDQSRHFVIASAHPSPLSAHRGFFNSKPFSRTNDYLIKVGRKPINWLLK